MNKYQLKNLLLKIESKFYHFLIINCNTKIFNDVYINNLNKCILIFILFILLIIFIYYF